MRKGETMRIPKPKNRTRSILIPIPSKGNYSLSRCLSFSLFLHFPPFPSVLCLHHVSPKNQRDRRIFRTKEIKVVRQVRPPIALFIYTPLSLPPLSSLHFASFLSFPPPSPHPTLATVLLTLSAFIQDSIGFRSQLYVSLLPSVQKQRSHSTLRRYSDPHAQAGNPLVSIHSLPLLLSRSFLVSSLIS
ncbi:hypothetical protein BC939DRAFT_68126 [Gamsiella multidivaricata]|uniref:uncharacterized protein n=1 Tax=Gamsiella multidivaricata TaxID=101098 RepID=UPI00221F746C|nr:uncharacterized protein BC939DRAFT_68126 [Gamsiella multidivaricata]KAI7828115.1 hypothetical protein BC939DRAFT_68126 [Gamsiella multidivaricata]